MKQFARGHRARSSEAGPGWPAKARGGFDNVQGSLSEAGPPHNFNGSKVLLPSWASSSKNYVKNYLL